VRTTAAGFVPRRDRGFTIGPFDLLIATVALHYHAEVMTPPPGWMSTSEVA
jgi:predicted nucleic acid-binding protein